MIRCLTSTIFRIACRVEFVAEKDLHKQNLFCKGVWMTGSRPGSFALSPFATCHWFGSFATRYLSVLDLDQLKTLNAGTC